MLVDALVLKYSETNWMEVKNGGQEKDSSAAHKPDDTHHARRQRIA
jgi:hypothetical protein